jgi:hypothetical protein
MDRYADDSAELTAAWNLKGAIRRDAGQVVSIADSSKLAVRLLSFVTHRDRFHYDIWSLQNHETS